MATKGSEALREAMFRRGRGAQKALAEKLRVSEQAVSRWATGAASPVSRYRLALQEDLGIPWRAWDEPAEDSASATPTPSTPPEQVA